jgi:hypothetical protein
MAFPAGVDLESNCAGCGGTVGIQAGCNIPIYHG